VTNPAPEPHSAFSVPHSALERPDLLAALVAGTRRIVEVREAREPRGDLERRAHNTARTAGRFQAAVSAADRVNIVAECKRRSPSRGVLRPAYDPVPIASAYVDAGAAAISVLTEPTFFDGSLEHLAAVRSAVDVPLLRKDFIVSEYQLLEALAAGADAVLLIVAALRPVELKVLHDHALTLGLDALVEVHDSTELSIAVDVGARIIGVNNRNLRTLDVELHASEELMAQMPGDVAAVSESGIRSSEDVQRLRQLGYRAFLIGERFMTAEDPGRELKALLEGCPVVSGTRVAPLTSINGGRATDAP
jgi:indole-3-glycerol phosphate synthase